MALNIVLSVVLFAVFGSIAHSIVGGSGGLLHNAFVGFAGSVLADVVTRVFGFAPYGLIRNLLLYLVGSCVVALIIESIKHKYAESNNSEE